MRNNENQPLGLYDMQLNLGGGGRKNFISKNYAVSAIRVIFEMLSVAFKRLSCIALHCLVIIGCIL
jgi:hypothetical protein